MAVTKSRLTHSKFSINAEERRSDGFSPSGLRGELNQTSSNGNLFKMTLAQNEGVHRTHEISTDMNGRNPIRATTSESTTKDKPKMKHHLEQVYIKPLIDKRNFL